MLFSQEYDQTFKYTKIILNTYCYFDKISMSSISNTTSQD